MITPYQNMKAKTREAPRTLERIGNHDDCWYLASKRQAKYPYRRKQVDLSQRAPGDLFGSGKAVRPDSGQTEEHLRLAESLEQNQGQPPRHDRYRAVRSSPRLMQILILP